MKKLLLIVALVAAVFCADTASACSDNRCWGYTTSVSVSQHANRIGRISYRPTHYRFHGHRFGLRHGFRAYRLGYRHGFHRYGRRFGHRRVAFAR